MRHERKQKKRRLSALSWILICAALFGIGFGGVAAYLSTQTPPVNNTFAAETAVQPTIQETMADNVKTNVSVNVGDPGYAVYVRAAVVITWQDADGNFLAEAPEASTADEEKDYTIAYNTQDWFSYGGFWYCKTMVNSGNSPVLIASCTPKAEKSDYHLNVEIISQTIQALGTTDTGNTPVVTAAWGVQVIADGAQKGELQLP